MSGRLIATETCVCGATFKADGWGPQVSLMLKGWRDEHKHAEAVGICGDRPQPLMLGDVEVGRPHCVLKAGHAGMHSDGEGHWRYDAATEPATGPRSDEQPSGVALGAEGEKA